jgi:hypothetical protein
VDFSWVCRVTDVEEELFSFCSGGHFHQSEVAEGDCWRSDSSTVQHLVVKADHSNVTA